MTQRVWGLDFLRAAAVVGVLFSHIQGQTNVRFYLDVLPIGPIFGVELFFVLSGFLIGQILIKTFIADEFGAATAYAFMRRRWYRTLPNYYLFFVVSLLIQPGASLDLVLPFLVFLQNVLSKPDGGFYGVTWSLSIEEIFYVLFPATLVIFQRLKLRPDTKLICAIACFILIPLLLRYTAYADSSHYGAADYRKAVVLRLDAIAYGVLMAFVKLRVTSLWAWLSRQGLWLLVPFWYVFMVNRFPKLILADWATIYYPLCSALMALTLPFFDSIKTNRSLFSVPVSFLATISYSLYLCHIPVIIVSNRYLHIHGALSGHSLVWFYFIASCFVAYLVHIMWEKPMTNLRDR